MKKFPPGRLAPAITLEDAETMRLVRNTCRHFMTNNTQLIADEEQKLWFVGLDRSTIKPFVFVIDDEGSHRSIDIGYGLVRLIDRKWWVSGGLFPELRGKGYGKQLFRALADVVRAEHKDCWLAVRADNLSARHVYESIGFTYVDSDTNGLAPSFIMRRLP